MAEESRTGSIGKDRPKRKEESEKLTEEAIEEEKPEYMEVALEVHKRTMILVSAAYQEGNLFRGKLYVKVTLEADSKLEEAKELLEKEYQQKDPEG